MSDLSEAAACNADGCAVGERAPASKGVAEKAKTLSVEIVSDAICPRCYVAKRQLERAVARLPDDVVVSAHWRPFELNPTMPVEGMDRFAYR